MINSCQIIPHLAIYVGTCTKIRNKTLCGIYNILFEGKLKFKRTFSLTIEFTNRVTRVIWVCTLFMAQMSDTLSNSFLTRLEIGILTLRFLG